mgnify:FL=1
MNNKIRIPLLVQSGFTLIELMIVIAILGILASIAISSYADYSIRAKISEASAMVAPFTTAVGTYYWANSTLPVSLEQAGQTNVVTKYIESITITSSGLISVDINENSTGVSGITADDLFVILTPVIATGAIVWTCKVNNIVDGTGDNTNMFRFVPAKCR